MKPTRWVLTGLLVAAVWILISCGQDDGESVSQLQATIDAQGTQIAMLQKQQPPEVAAEEKDNRSATQTAQAAALTVTAESEITQQATVELGPTPTVLPSPVPAPTQAPALEEQVSVELISEAVVKDMWGESLYLIFAIENNSDTPVDASFDVRFYDESGVMTLQRTAMLCESHSSLPYVPAGSQAWATVSILNGDPLPASHRTMDIQVRRGCRMNRDNYYDFLGYGRRGEETAYDKVILTSPGIKVEPISFSDYDTATLEGLLENTGDRDTSTVYVQATGFNEDGLPIFETVVLHGQPIPAGEKMRLSGHLYSTNPSFLDGSIGDFSDIVSWRFVVAAMTLVTPGLQG